MSPQQRVFIGKNSPLFKGEMQEGLKGGLISSNMNDKDKIFNPKRTKATRKYLRNNMTKAEIILWSKLKGRQLANTKFRRQHGIGKYIVDFYSAKYKLIIEVDGDSHYSEQGKRHDYERDRYLDNLDLKIIRFTNEDVKKDLSYVLEAIEQTIQSLK
ncbi:MAG TPA: endonuclease domain-containing protein [Balneolaceae bacterium]|nr:endonuclease domain-containing protein [Balneolaceae bacterium]